MLTSNSASAVEAGCMVMFICALNSIVFLFKMLQYHTVDPVMLAQHPAWLAALDLRELGQVSQRKQCRSLQLRTRRWRHCCQNRVCASRGSFALLC